MIRNDLWATPVWEFDTGFSGAFNSQLLSQLNSIKMDSGPDFNIWKLNSPYLDELKKIITKVTNEAVVEDIPKNKRLVITRGWLNTHRTGTSLATHYHGNSTIACTYYIKAPSNCGDLLLIDPRGGVNWGWETEGEIQGIKHTRVKPKEGSLVFFPGFLLHSVEENKSQLPRISLSSNLTLQ